MSESYKAHMAPPHKPADNDDDYPPSVPIPMPVPAQKPIPQRSRTV